MAELFGFEIKRKTAQKELPSFVPKTDEDGSGVIQAGGHFGAYIDMDGDKVKNEVELILKYRDISAQPECDAAIEDIINESIVGDHDESPVVTPALAASIEAGIMFAFFCAASLSFTIAL